jgi:hypothetical protein
MAAATRKSNISAFGKLFRLRGALFLSLLWAMAACTPQSADPDEGQAAADIGQNQAASNDWQRQIDEAEERWQEGEIASYEIEVLHVSSIWEAQRYRIKVVNGEVFAAEAQCIPAPMQMGECEVHEYQAEDYTVEGLFARARVEAGRGGGDFTQIEFDAVYGFPTRISYDQPDVLDEEQSWRVMAFDALD